MQTIYLDISNKGVYPCIYAKQGDINRKFLLIVTDGGVPFNCENTAISVWYDGDSGEGNYTHIGEENAISVTGNKITVSLIQQMLVNAGNGVLSISISNPDGGQIGLWNIDYCVEEKPGAESEEATQYYDAFSQTAADIAKSAETIGKTQDRIDSIIKAKNATAAGLIYPLASANVPSGFLLCDGAEYSRTEYAELFDAIGTVYGEGDGSTTFNIPNLSTRVPVGSGVGYEIGKVGGEEKHKLTLEEMPSHKHGTTQEMTGYSGWSGTTSYYTPPGYQAEGESNATAVNGPNTNSAGGDQPHNIMQPYTVVNYIISTGKEVELVVGRSVGSKEDTSNAVLYIEQKLTEEEKEQARANIGAAEVKTASQSGEVIDIDLPKDTKISVTADIERSVKLIHQGKNFLPTLKNAVSTAGITATPQANGAIAITNTPPTEFAFVDIIPGATPMYLPAGRYRFSAKFNNSEQNVAIAIVNKTTNSTLLSLGNKPETCDQFMVLDEITPVYCYMGLGTGTRDTTIKLQLERSEDSVASLYEPFVRHEYNVTLPYTLNALDGTNILYTDGGDIITATYTPSDDVDAFDYKAYGLPVLFLTGDTTNMNKDDAVTLDYVYGNRAGTCTCKWQGSSSLGYPKKNYTIKFDSAFEAADGWGEQKKYCFKANFIDHSHARNICSCKLWGMTVKSRPGVPSVLSGLPNGGAIDGFPCIIMLNGDFHGLYTWNIPKDGWMFGAPKAILCADGHVAATQFKGLATLDGDFDLEYVEDESNSDWVLSSINTAIQAVMNSDGTDLDTVVNQYIDIPSAIDYYIHAVLEQATDATDKNYLLVTFDGVKWYFSNYDRDTTYGMFCDGKLFLNPLADVTFADYANLHRLMGLIRQYKTEELKSRYLDIRANAMNEGQVFHTFTNFAADIPSQILDEDARRWPEIPSTNASNVAQILNWYRLRSIKCDADINAM